MTTRHKPGRVYHLDRHAGGWMGVVFLGYCPSGLAWVRDPERGDYPCMPSDLKSSPPRDARIRLTPTTARSTLTP